MTSKLTNLFEFDDEKQFSSGTVFRIHNVKRLDIIKHESDYRDKKKSEADFYDFLLIDTNALADGTFALINITLDSNNRGDILCILNGKESRYYLNAIVLKEYFVGNDDIYVLNG